MTDRRSIVKELFENTGHYLTYDYNLQIRKETVQTFTAGMHFNQVLDMPCGNGSISMPLLDRTNHLDFTDISSNMIALTTKAIPEKHRTKTKVIQGDFFELEWKENSYELIICLGLLAHVNSPEQLIHKLAGLIKPGGYLIIQNTDSSHFYSYLIRAYLGLKNIFQKQSYLLNKIPASFVEEHAQKNNLSLFKTYRYNQSFLGFSNLFSNERKYKLTTGFFGNADRPKNQSLGSDYTYLFKKPE